MGSSEIVGEGASDQQGSRYQPDLLTERRLLLPLLETLTAAQWNNPTLCEGWRVREVVAHLTYSWSNTLHGIPTWLRYRQDTDRAFSLFAQQRAQADDRVLLRRYGKAVESDYTPPKVTAEVLWCDNVLHGLDIRHPMGLRYPGSKKTLTRAAETLTTMTWPSRTTCRSDGLQFVATDIEWSVGTRPQVAGPIEETLLAIAGRCVTNPVLDGEGLALLIQR